MSVSSHTLTALHTRQPEHLAAVLAMPLFVCPGKNLRTPLQSLPPLCAVSLDLLPKAAEECLQFGIRQVVLYGVRSPQRHTTVCAAITALHRTFPELTVITDVCVCSDTAGGQCLLQQDGSFDNDSTLEALAHSASEYAGLGSQWVMVSGMVDGAVAHIRSALNASNLGDVMIASQASKIGSSLYGPFREGVGTSLQGSKMSYQLDPANGRQGRREMLLDTAEGADMIIVKPALTSLDLLAAGALQCETPMGAFMTSGEYAMLRAGEQAGVFTFQHAMHEYFEACVRAGAALVVSYGALIYMQRVTQLI